MMLAKYGAGFPTRVVDVVSLRFVAALTVQN